MEKRDADNATEGTPEGLRYARPAVDRVRMEEARASVARGLFRAAEPARVGRFVIVEPLAAGGMGVVYRAYDPQLDRKVALKVIHPRAGDSQQARERLIGEARALAQVKHPNVVPVHDVLAVDDQVVIVMELVEGRTLTAWERERPQTWREIVAVYVAAGRGLAAAHALKVVHRDFKPANVIVGDDGRVRVLDFGLARVVATDGEPIADGAAAPSAELTATGELVGTPAYMAPEQLAGGAASPASDQFSFCVALHQALFGARPFAGEGAEQLLAAIRAGRIAPPGDARRVPSWLRALVVRGLRAAPDDRHASMPRLLDQLDREHGWRRWRFVAVVALLATIATVAIARGHQPADPLATCDDGGAALDAVWNPARRDQLRAALAAVGTPYAREIVGRVLGGLDAYRADWARMDHDACVAHRRGLQSGGLFDRRVLCLQRRKGDLANSVAVLAQVDRTSVDRAVDVVAGLPPIAWCEDLEALAAESDPPASAAARDQVAALRLRLSQAAALERAGRLDEALVLAGAALSDARTLGYAPAEIEAALTDGRLLLDRDDRAAAVPILSAAEALALEHGDLSAAVVAAARRLFAEGLEGTDLDGLRRQAAILEPLSRSIAADHFARPLLLNNIGVVYMASGDRAPARRYFEEARAALAGVAAPDLELTCVDKNVAMLTADPAVRVPLARAVWERLRDRLGAAHPSTIAALYAYGHYLPDPASARTRIDEACELYRRFHPEFLAARAECEHYRAFLTAELGDRAAAVTGYAEVAALARGATDRDVVSWGELAAGEVSLVHSDARGALPHFAAVITAFAGPDLGDRMRAAYGHLGAGIAEHTLGHDAAAIPHLELAERGFVDAAALNEDLESPQRLALTRATLAAARRAP